MYIGLLLIVRKNSLHPSSHPPASCAQSSKVMARRAVSHPKVEVLFSHECQEAYGGEDGTLSEQAGAAGGVWLA